MRLTVEEAWEVVAASHTGILTTLRADGMPITLPVWFVVVDRAISLAAPSGTKKLARIRNDPRASFLVETGERWVDLEAVHFTGRIEIVEDDALIACIDTALDAKYAAFRPVQGTLPDATQRHYAGRAFLRLVPDERVLSWRNRRVWD